ncbi:MAG: hypothetical protein IT342_04520 [Candidatus Melainabacteria bacterium]|nr:hypothetical protein [Candidatus Melainabacteria bacterium]
MNRKANSIVSYAVAMAVCFTTTACSEGEKYGKEVERETTLSVTQAPYNFSLSAKCRDEGDSTLRLNIQRENSFVNDAQVSAKLLTTDGNEQAAQFHEVKAEQRYEAAVPLKHHADYMVKTEILIDGKTFSPIFSFHSGDPALEKMDKKEKAKGNFAK